MYHLFSFQGWEIFWDKIEKFLTTLIKQVNKIMENEKLSFKDHAEIALSMIRIEPLFKASLDHWLDTGTINGEFSKALKLLCTIYAHYQPIKTDQLKDFEMFYHDKYGENLVSGSIEAFLKTDVASKENE